MKFYPGWADRAGKLAGAIDRRTNAELGAMQQNAWGRKWGKKWAKVAANRDAEQTVAVDPNRSRRGGLRGASAIRTATALDRIDAELDAEDGLAR